MEHTSFFNQKQNQVLGALALLMVIVALGAYAHFTFKQADNMYGSNTITVTGEGEVVAKPDTATFSFSVIEKGEDATSTRALANTKTNAIIAFLKAEGIAENDIKTENYSVYPTYEWIEEPCPIGMYCPGGESVQTGFEISQSITVKARDLEKVGSLVAGVTDQGATNLSSLQFSIDDTSALEDQARKQAIANAKAKADLLSQELEVKIVKMVSFYEEEIYDPYYGDYGMGGDMMMKVEAGITPEIPVGETTTKKRVNITYQID
jgi:uncharacterized protein